jgi:hypothetical protein
MALKTDSIDLSKTSDEPSRYPGLGTEESPYGVSFVDGDPANPRNWSNARKWM